MSTYVQLGRRKTTTGERKTTTGEEDRWKRRRQGNGLNTRNVFRKTCWPNYCKKYHTWSCVRNWRDNILLRSKLKAANNWTVVPINEKKGYTYMH
ncbi:hypothetical protein DPMN_080190 [Dreissena polymorpha]|uniref:Uncharacterized protein n=1 Tax=Dreissena polymorpha TaxID=45954 RepID=A0A9D3YUJ6_DREPO|nr:hypothetical protein DPMN_080190 [Dreissena polymorpha]